MKDFLKAPFSNVVGLLLALVIAAGVFLGGSTSAPDLVTLGETNFGTVQVDDGSCSSPAYAYTSDTNTGLYRIGTDNVGWCAGGTLALDVNANGTVDFAQAINPGTLNISGVISQTLVNAAGGSANPYDYTGTLGIMDNSDDFTLFDVNLTNANHTGSSNTVAIMDIAGITGDAQAQENAINVGSGWDLDFNCTTSCDFGVGNMAYASLVTTALNLTPATIAADTSEDVVEVAWANSINTTGTNTQSGVNISLTNANHTGGTNNIYGLDVDGITADAQGTEYAINVDSGWDRGLNIAGGGAVIVGTVTLDTGEIGAGEIADPTRSVSYPINALIDCQTSAGAVIGFDTTADALPDYVVSSQTFLLRFDDTGGTEDEESEVCGTFTVPPTYASGGAFVIKAKKDAHAGATETLACAISVNGAALEAEGTVNTTASAATSYTCTPTIAALAAGDSVQFYIEVLSATTMDDVVDVLSIEFQYTATQ